MKFHPDIEQAHSAAAQSPKMHRYHTNPEFRARVLERTKRWARANPERRSAIMEAHRSRRKSDPKVWARYIRSQIKGRAARRGLLLR